MGYFLLVAKKLHMDYRNGMAVSPCYAHPLGERLGAMCWNPEDPIVAGTLLGWALSEEGIRMLSPATAVIPTPAGEMTVEIGDWIVCGADFFGVFKPSEFESLFKLA